VELTNKRSFFNQVASNFVFPNANTNSAENVELALVAWCIIPLPCCIFPRDSYAVFGKTYLKLFEENRYKFNLYFKEVLRIATLSFGLFRACF